MDNLERRSRGDLDREERERDTNTVWALGLSELAGAGHLALESRNGSLFYLLPGRDGPGLENRY